MATKRRGRNAKSALNQEKEAAKSALNKEKETKVIVSDEDIEMVEELHNTDLVEEVKEMTSEENDVKVDIDAIDFPTEPEGGNLPEAPEQPKEPEVEEEQPKVRTLADLSTAELRNFHRTGRMPQ